MQRNPECKASKIQSIDRPPTPSFHRHPIHNSEHDNFLLPFPKRQLCTNGRTYQGSQSPLVKAANASYNDNNSTLDQHGRYVKCNANDHAVSLSSPLTTSPEVRRKFTAAGYCLDEAITQHFQGLPAIPSSLDVPHISGTIAECQTTKTIFQGLYSDRRIHRLRATFPAVLSAYARPIPTLRMLILLSMLSSSLSTGSKSVTFFEPSSPRTLHFGMRDSFDHILICVLRFLWFSWVFEMGPLS